MFLLRQIKLKLLGLPLALFLISSCDLENPGGVLTNNQLPASVIEFFDSTDILENEQIIAYYLIYYKYGRVVRFPLSSIVSVEAEECFGLCIVATTKDDRVMEIEIAPLNGGDLFLELLKKQVDKA